MAQCIVEVFECTSHAEGLEGGREFGDIHFLAVEVEGGESMHGGEEGEGEVKREVAELEGKEVRENNWEGGDVDVSAVGAVDA